MSFLLLLFGCQIPASLCAADGDFPYKDYCYHRAAFFEQRGQKIDARNWYTRYIRIAELSLDFVPDEKYRIALLKSEQIRSENPLVWSDVEEEREIPVKPAASSKAKTLSPKMKKTKRERRVPALTAAEVALKAEKAEAAGQYATARRYYRLALRLDPALPEIQKRIEHLNEVLKP